MPERRKLPFPMRQALALILLAPAVFSCSRKLTQEECNHLLGRGVALAAIKAIPEPVVKQSGIYGVPIDIEALRKTARGKAKEALNTFDGMCPKQDDNGVSMCSRRAKNEEEFRACGGMALKAWDTGLIARSAVMRKFTGDECSKYAEHAVQIKAATADDVSALVKDCDSWMEIGVHECRMAAKDAAAWKTCAD
jgi:hypothetical protein